MKFFFHNTYPSHYNQKQNNQNNQNQKNQNNQNQNNQNNDDDNIEEYCEVLQDVNNKLEPENMENSSFLVDFESQSIIEDDKDYDNYPFYLFSFVDDELVVLQDNNTKKQKTKNNNSNNKISGSSGRSKNKNKKGKIKEKTANMIKPFFNFGNLSNKSIDYC